MFSIQSPSYIGVGILVSAEQLKDMYHIVTYIPSGGTKSPLIVLSMNYSLSYHYFFLLDCFSFVSAFPHFSN